MEVNRVTYNAAFFGKLGNHSGLERLGGMMRLPVKRYTGEPDTGQGMLDNRMDCKLAWAQR